MQQHASYWDFLAAKRARKKAMRDRDLARTAYNNATVVLPTIRRREAKFVDLLFPRIVFMMKKITKKKLDRNAAIGAGLAVLNDSGYRTKVYNNDGNFNEAAVQKVDDLMQLPRIQNAMALKFAGIGFGEDEANELLIHLMRESRGNAKDLLPSLKLYYELTGAVGSNRGVVVNNNTLNAIQAPKVYDAGVWSQEPKMIVSEDKDV